MKHNINAQYFQFVHRAEWTHSHYMPCYFLHPITESGRLFVWGENQFGQLGTGAAEIVTKPSCVKAIKSLGHKVRNIAFGEHFSVVLTGSAPF